MSIAGVNLQLLRGCVVTPSTLLMVCFRLANCRYVISLLVKQTFLLANYPFCESVTTCNC